MGYLSRVAFKNLSRNRFRTLFSVLAVAISVMVVVFTKGLMGGFIESTYQDQIQYSTGHIRIVKDEYRQKERLLSLNYPVDGFNGEGLSAVIEELEEIDKVQMAIPRLRFGAAASVKDELIQLMAWGVDPGKEVAFTDIDEQLVEGRMIEPGQREIVVGAGLLEKLQVGVGDSVTLVFNTAFGSLRGVTFQIVGKVESSLPMLNDSVAYMPLDQAQKFLYMEDQATEVLVVGPSASRVDEIVPAVEDLFARENANGAYAVIPWNKSGILIYWLQLAERIYNVIYVFLVGLASIVVINTMVMIVKERTREIGMMTALGLESKEIQRMFIFEGAFMGVIGSLVGAILGGVVTSIFARIGLDYSAALEDLGEEILMEPIIYPVFTPSDMLFGFVIGAIVTAIACIVPARRAAKLEPSQALRDI